MPDPFDPRPCCILGVCCAADNPDSAAKREQALRDEVLKTLRDTPEQKDASRDQLAEHLALVAARSVLDRYDLVPKGLGAAIVSAYGPLFAQKLGRKG